MSRRPVFPKEHFDEQNTKLIERLVRKDKKGNKILGKRLRNDQQLAPRIPPVKSVVNLKSKAKKESFMLEQAQMLKNN